MYGNALHCTEYNRIVRFIYVFPANAHLRSIILRVNAQLKVKSRNEVPVKVLRCLLFFSFLVATEISRNYRSEKVVSHVVTLRRP